MKILNRFMKWYWGDNDTEKEPPRDGLKRALFLLINFPGKMMLLNLIFILSCIPIFTVPAAVSGMQRYLIRMFRDGYGFSVSDYFREFRQSLFRRIPAFIPAIIIIFYGYYLMSLSGNFSDGVIEAWVFGTGFAVLTVGGLLFTWMGVLSAMFDIPNGALLKNALILLITEWKTNGKLFAFYSVYFFLMGSFFPYSMFILAALGFSFPALVSCAFINSSVQRRILTPFEEKEVQI